MALPAATVTFVIAPAPNADGSVNITLSSTHVAAYVTLTTLAAGRFSDNSFFIVPPTSTVVQFIPFGTLNNSKLVASLRVEHVAMYQ